MIFRKFCWLDAVMSMKKTALDFLIRARFEFSCIHFERCRYFWMLHVFIPVLATKVLPVASGSCA